MQRPLSPDHHLLVVLPTILPQCINALLAFGLIEPARVQHRADSLDAIVHVELRRNLYWAHA